MIILSESISSYDPIVIGKKTEYGYKKLQFDLSEYIEKYGSGGINVTFTRYNSEASYLIHSTLSDSTLSVIISGSETAFIGDHTITINFYPSNGHIIAAEIPVTVLEIIQNVYEDAPIPIEDLIDTSFSSNGYTLIIDGGDSNDENS